MIQSRKWIARFMAVAVVLGISTEGLARTVKTTDTPFRPEVRALGMGGAYIAAGKNGGAFLYNPALLTQTTTDIALPFSIGFDQNTFNIFHAEGLVEIIISLYISRQDFVENIIKQRFPVGTCYITDPPVVGSIRVHDGHIVLYLFGDEGAGIHSLFFCAKSKRDNNT